MRVETLVVDGQTRLHYIEEPGDHIILTGPVQGLRTLSDGTQVDLTPDYVNVGSSEHRDEVLDLIGLQHVENGHPLDVDRLVDPETGETVLVQRPFTFIDSSGEEHVGVGTPLGEHPLDNAEPEA